jgi:serine protease Do
MNTPVDNYIQTDAAINHGNSGGPVLDREGKVLAVATILVTSGEGQGSQGLGFGIASDLASLTAKHLLDPNAAPLSWIGVHLQDVTPALKSAFHVQHLGEFLVIGIDAGSPAEQAGLLSGDVITRFGDSRPANSSELMMDIIQTPHGTRVSVSFERQRQADADRGDGGSVDSGGQGGSGADAHNAGGAGGGDAGAGGASGADHRFGAAAL